MTKSTSILTDPYIYVEKNVLTKHRCKSMINKFNKDNRRHQGVTAGGLSEHIKQSTDLNITDHIQGWEQHDKHLHAKLTPLLEKYYDLAVSSYTDPASAGFAHTSSNQTKEFTKARFKRYYKNN